MEEDMTICDVLVIGAGPGGGNAALQCARLGLDTILVEDHDEIGTPVPVSYTHLTLPTIYSV